MPYADVFDGAPGIDLLDDYSADGDPRFAAPIAVTLDGLANDGKPGEYDNVTGIERLTPGSAGTFVRDDGPNYVTMPEVGAGGSLDGRGGDDVLTAGRRERRRGGQGRGRRPARLPGRSAARPATTRRRPSSWPGSPPPCAAHSSGARA
jgi:hypothetical protein